MKEYKIETFRAKGNGGQNVNTRETAVRITHLPTGLQAQCQDERDQAQNKARAFEILHKRIELQKRLDKARELQAFRDSMHKGRVRTYDLTRDMVTDNIRGVKISGARKVLDGHLELLDK